MRDKNRIAQQALQRICYVIKPRCIVHVGIGNPRQLFDGVGNLGSWIDFGFKLIDNLACLNQHAANLDNPIAMLDTGTGSFQVNDRIDRLARV